MKDKIENFWQWFVAHEDKIIGCLEDNTSPHKEFVIEHLNNFILTMGMFKWDIGEGKDNPWFLTISPNGDAELLDVSKQIMGKAPAQLNWEFHASQQVKDWNYELTVYDNNMDEQHINAANWKFISHKTPNGQQKIIFEADNISHIDNETLHIIADLVLLNEIGEEAKITYISKVEIIESIEINQMQNKIQSLKSQILKSKP